MTIADILQEVKAAFHREGDLLAAEVLLAFVLKQSKEYLIIHSKDELLSNVEADFRILFKKFLNGEPIAYLIGNKEFFGMNFYVDRRVLIPRPETELLVEKVLDFSNQLRLGRSLKILDVGTGSGCIALSLAKNLVEAQVVGVDISVDALEVANINAKNHDLFERVEFKVSNLLENLDESFDIIVANLPYIGEKRFNFVSKEAYDYEPHVALFGGDDGLYLYKSLFQQLLTKKWQPFLLTGEFGFLQSEALQQMIRKYFPQHRFEIFEDYANIERVFTIYFDYA